MKLAIILEDGKNDAEYSFDNYKSSTEVSSRQLFIYDLSF